MRRRHRKSLRLLEQLGRPPYSGDWQNKTITQRSVLARHGGECHGRRIGATGLVLGNLIWSCEHTLRDRVSFIDDVLELHGLPLARYRGADGVRDRGLLESAIAQPRSTFGPERRTRDGQTAGRYHCCIMAMRTARQWAFEPRDLHGLGVWGALLGAALLAGCGSDDTTQGAGAAPNLGGNGQGGSGTAASGAGQGGSGAPDGGNGAGLSGGAGPACGSLLVETVSTGSTVPTPGGAMPAAGQPVLVPETGVSVRRISDGADPGATATAYTNGYSRWSPANRTGEYVTAFGDNGGADIYRLSDRTIVRSLPVGEPNELHWDSSEVGGTDTTIYYRQGTELRRTDVIAGTDEPVHDFAVEYPAAGAALNGVEGAPSGGMRYWAFQICTDMSDSGQCVGLLDIVTYDLELDAIIGRLSDQEADIPTPNFVDMSPSGARMVVGSCKESGSTPEPWNGPYAWSLDFTERVRVGTNCTHSGWAWGSSGEEYYVSYDSCGAANEEVTETCDQMVAVNVRDSAGWENRIGILNQADIGWGVSNHVGRIYDQHVPGWFFMSTYGDDLTPWAAHQLFFVEIAPVASNPRIFRVAPTATATGDYWTEAFASLDFQAQHVYWGSNWDGAGDLQLYQATLCSEWWVALAAR